VSEEKTTPAAAPSAAAAPTKVPIDIKVDALEKLVNKQSKEIESLRELIGKKPTTSSISTPAKEDNRVSFKEGNHTFYAKVSGINVDGVNLKFADYTDKELIKAKDNYPHLFTDKK
jgi:ABC-type taurine transport system substrate-binding protein